MPGRLTGYDDIYTRPLYVIVKNTGQGKVQSFPWHTGEADSGANTASYYTGIRALSQKEAGRGVKLTTTPTHSSIFMGWSFVTTGGYDDFFFYVIYALISPSGLFRTKILCVLLVSPARATPL
jgi:amino acid permease